MTAETLGPIQELSRLEHWSAIDFCLAALLGSSAIFGFLRGFIQEAISVMVWLAALWVSVQYCQDAATLLQDKISIAPVRLAVACAMLFFATLFVGSLINSLLIQAAIDRLSGGERLLGLLFGLLRGAFLVFLLVLLAGTTHLPETGWWRQSRLLPPFQAAALWVKAQMPPAVAAYVNYR